MEDSTLIVSLHDVAPPTFERVRRQREALAGWGVERASLLAVPFYHGAKRLDEDLSLCQWLLDRQAREDEVVLHGWRHESSTFDVRRSAFAKATADKSTFNPLKAWFYQNLYTAGEAEFLELGYDEARSRMEEGLKMLKGVGLEVTGFIPPAWLMNPEVERAARDLGLIYTNAISQIIHLENGKRSPSRSCVWSSRAGWRRLCSRAWNAGLFKCLQGAEPMRISLHPSDLEYPAIWRQIGGMICRALENRKATTYGEWIE